MPVRDFRELLAKQWEAGKFLSIGLDPHQAKLPQGLDPLQFNKAIIEATHHVAGVFKPQSAAYEALGDDGMAILRETIAYAQAKAPDVPIVLDAKRADIGTTSEDYAKTAFDYLNADAVTLHPYLGEEALKPFLEHAEKGCFILCRTSNPGAAEFQDLIVEYRGKSLPLYLAVAQQVATVWNRNGNCGLVVGATYPEELQQVRQLVGDMPILIPGVGAQGGSLEEAVKGSLNSQGQGMLIHATRSIIFASSGPDFAEAAKKAAEEMHQELSKIRKNLL